MSIRQFFACALAALLSISVSGQSSSQAVTAFFLQTDVERGYVLCPSGTGTIYLAGMTDVDMVLMEFSTEGALLSSRFIDVGISGLDVTAGMIVDSEGKIVVCGNLQQDSPDNGYVFRYDPVTRKTLWAKTFTAGNTLVYGVLENGPGGNFWVYANPHEGGGDDTEIYQFNRDNGNIVPGNAWRYHLGSSDQISTLALHDGALYGVGRFTDGAGFSFMRQALTRINPVNGQPNWTRLGHLPPAADARLYGRDLVIDQNAIISTFSGNDAGTDLSVSNIFLQKTSLDGDLIWLKKIDLPEWNSESAEEIVSVPDGYVLYGKPLSAAENSLFLAKTDKDGNLQWARKFQKGSDKAHIIAVAQNQIIAIGDAIYATGYTETAAGLKNMFLLKVSKDGQISDSCAAWLPTQATVVSVNDPVHYAVFPLADTSLTGVIDFPAAPSVPFFPDREFVCQQIINPGCADWTLKIDGVSCDNGQMAIAYTLCNTGDALASGDVSAAFYTGDPTLSAATLLGVYVFDGALDLDECRSGVLTVPGNDWFPGGPGSPQTIFAVINDNGTLPTPYSFAGFPPTGITECAYDNNLAQAAVQPGAPAPNLGPDLIVCKNNSAVLDAGAGYIAYLWNDGTTAQTLTATDPGTYWVEVTDACGFRQRDSVFFSFSLLPDTQFPDTTICPGAAVTYSVPGFDTYAWAPASGLNCTNCPSVTIQPQTTTQYTLLALTNLGCELRDTFVVEVRGPANLALQCPANIVVAAAPNAATAKVNYDPPALSSDCPCGPANLTLLQGPASGADFPLGITQVCFRAEDACATQQSCCFTVTVNQTGGDEPCDVKETPCVRFEILGITQNPALQRTYRMRVVNKCPEPLQYVAFQLPDGASADYPAGNSVYTAPSGRQYEVRNPNAAPFRSVRFRATGNGIAGGQSDIFEYTLPPQSAPTFIGAIARLAPQQFFETHLNVFACEVRQVADRPADERRPGISATGQLRVFPNPVGAQIFVDLSAWDGQEVRLCVSDARGLLLMEQKLVAAAQPYEMEIPDAWPNGVYFLSVRTGAGERYDVRLMRVR